MASSRVPLKIATTNWDCLSVLVMAGQGGNLKRIPQDCDKILGLLVAAGGVGPGRKFKKTPQDGDEKLGLLVAAGIVGPGRKFKRTPLKIATMKTQDVW